MRVTPRVVVTGEGRARHPAGAAQGAQGVQGRSAAGVVFVCSTVLGDHESAWVRWTARLVVVVKAGHVSQLEKHLATGAQGGGAAGMNGMTWVVGIGEGSGKAEYVTQLGHAAPSDRGTGKGCRGRAQQG